MFNTPAWAGLVENSYGYPARVYCAQGFEIHYSYVRNSVGEYFVAPSFGDFIYVGTKELDVIERWAYDFAEMPIKVRVYCGFFPEMRNFDVKRSGFIHEIQFDSYDSWYEKKAAYRFKRNIKLARKHNLKIQIERDKRILRKFWEMHANLRMRKFGEIPQPWKYFENLFSTFINTGRGFILSAYDRNNLLIAGVLVILHEDVAYYKFNASLPDCLETRPNNLLMDRLVYYLSNLNIKKLNLGFTGSDPGYDGLRTFKLTAGAVEFMRYTLETPSFSSLNRSMIQIINDEIRSFIHSNPSFDEVDKIAMKYYKSFI